MTARSIAVAMLLAGCSGGAPKDPTYTPAGPKPCERMADHLVGLMQPKDETGKPIDPDPDTADKITRVLIRTCTDDKWTIDAQTCVEQLQTFQDFERCAPLLTVEQRDSLVHTFDAAFPNKPSSK